MPYQFSIFLFQSLVNQQGGLQYFFVVFLVGVFHARPFFFSFMTTFFLLRFVSRPTFETHIAEHGKEMQDNVISESQVIKVIL